MKKQVCQIDGLDIAYVDSGKDAQAIVFVHGNSGASHDFASQFNSTLTREYRLVALDLPGHGDSGRVPLETYGIPFYSSVLVAFLRELSLERSVLVGWSLGGHIVLESVDALPDSPGFLIYGTPPLASPPDIESAFLPNPTFAAGMTGELDYEAARAYAEASLGDRKNDALVQSFTDGILATDPNARAGLAASTVRPIVDEVLLVARMKQPLAILHGGQEKLVSLPYILGLTAPTLWRKEVQVVQDAGHAIQVESTQTFNRLIYEFTDEVTRS